MTILFGVLFKLYEKVLTFVEYYGIMIVYERMVL